MPRRPCAFRQQDVTRALRAADAAGYAVHRVVIDKTGNIVIETGKSSENAETCDAEKTAA